MPKPKFTAPRRALRRANTPPSPPRAAPPEEVVVVLEEPGWDDANSAPDLIKGAWTDSNWKAGWAQSEGAPGAEGWIDPSPGAGWAPTTDQPSDRDDAWPDPSDGDFDRNEAWDDEVWEVVTPSR